MSQHLSQDPCFSPNLWRDLCFVCHRLQERAASRIIRKLPEYLRKLRRYLLTGQRHARALIVALEKGVVSYFLR